MTTSILTNVHEQPMDGHEPNENTKGCVRDICQEIQKYSHVSKMSRQTGSQSGKSENTKLRTSNWRGKGKTRPTKRKHGAILCLRTYKKQQTLHSALSYTSKV